MTSDMPKIIVLMATYNGEQYIEQQIASIVEQTYKNWHLIIQDDGSQDGTLYLINQYAKNEERITVFSRKDSSQNSAKRNFASLLSLAKTYKAEYFCFSDQDDYWDPEKLSIQVNIIKEIEERGQVRDRPILVHSDLQVVDKNLLPLNHSFVKLMHLKLGCEINPARLLARNEVTGCASMFNKSLLELASSIPDPAIMHDWWMALVASYTGNLEFIDLPLVKYRQHGGNVIGAKSFWHGLNPFNNCFIGWQKGNAEFFATVIQAKSLHSHLLNSKLISETKLEEIKLYSEIPRMSRINRIKAVISLSIWRSHWLLNLVLFFRLILLPRQRP